MSYARFGWDGSDVYVYASVNGSIECCACALNEPGPPNAFGLSFPPSWQTPTRGPEYDPSKPRRRGELDMPRATYDEMIDHLLVHAREGHHVPNDVWVRLTEERDEIAEG